MADTDAEHEPSWKVRAEGRVGGGSLAGLVAPDVEDARCGDEGRRCFEDRTDVRHVWRAAQPKRAVSEVLRELRRFRCALDAEGAIARPDADLPDVHRSIIRWFASE